jgi:cobalamin biosynthesis Mg chelatase CobN
MTDWEEITGYIQNAMQAVDQAHQVSENLRNHTTPENFNAFKEHMQELYEHLGTLKYLMEHESKASMDEVVDALSWMFSGKPASYRTTPRDVVPAHTEE